MGKRIRIEDLETEEKLAELRAMTKYTIPEIADILHIHRSTLYRWIRKSEAIKTALTIQFDRESVLNVEHAMYDACFDRPVKVKITKQVLDREGHVHDLTEIRESVIPADVRAQKYWLNNRNPDRWKDKPVAEEEGSDTVEVIFEAGEEAWNE